MFKKLIKIALLLFLTTHLIGQEIEIPKDIKLETPEDYKNSETLLLQCIEWAQDTPIDQDKSKRQEVSRFFLQWITGSPTITIDIVSGIIPTECPECLFIFMAGWTKYSLNNNYSDNKVECALAGVESTIDFYNKNKSEIGKNSSIKKLIKKKKKGKLRKYIKSQFK